MAELADRKRQQYADHAAPFQRPAANARRVHEEFLPRLLAWDGFEVLVHDVDGTVDAFAVARFGAAPPPFGEGSLFHVDDFAVAAPHLWATAGAAVLGELARRAGAAGLETAIVVSGPSSVDAPKTRFLISAGLAAAAEWWVKPTVPAAAATPEQDGFEAAVGPAPPVYDPGGLTCLALTIAEPAAVVRFERFAAASQAVVAVVPVTVGQTDVRNELRRRVYAVASEWYAGAIETISRPS